MMTLDEYMATDNAVAFWPLGPSERKELLTEAIERLKVAEEALQALRDPRTEIDCSMSASAKAFTCPQCGNGLNTGTGIKCLWCKTWWPFSTFYPDLHDPEPEPTPVLRLEWERYGPWGNRLKRRWGANLPLPFIEKYSHLGLRVGYCGSIGWHGRIVIVGFMSVTRVWAHYYTRAFDARRGCERALRRLVEDLQEVVG